VVTPANIGRPAIVALSSNRSLFCAARATSGRRGGVNCSMMDLDSGQELWEETLAASEPLNSVPDQPSVALLDAAAWRCR
jgi:hypothetical protein